MASINRPRVFLDVNIGSEPAGRISIELFADKTPRTCENFRQLCTGEHNGLSFAKAPFHRIIDEFMIQGGDIDNGDGTGSTSIYGAEFEDENLNWRDMDAAGLVCSANRGKDTNGSQFFITLEACPHLNGKHTIFGHIVSGESTLQKISQVDVDKNDRPLEPVLISHCGELEKRKKTKPAVATHNTALTSHHGSQDNSSRGRRRHSSSHSASSDTEMENSPEPARIRGHRKKRRRQSDNHIDEGLRGRPRQRSGSRSPSRALSENSEDDEGGASPPRKHKRKRSASPSRHVEESGKGERMEGSYERRRRRSLPNQYAGKHGHEVDGEAERERRSRSPRRGQDRDYRHHDGREGGERGWDDRRREDRYRPYPERERNSYGGDGRLGGGGGFDEGNYDDPPVKFKGRGVMKYRG